MRILFVGPSLPDAAAFCGEAIRVCPPAAQGDVLAAARAGATAIGIVDGNFEHVAPIRHKEILHALASGIAVFGAASMGALRAAECATFGMTGIGRIYEDYASGGRIDDADVALLHGPVELGYPALSLPIVDAEATLDRLEAEEAIDKYAISKLRNAARILFYKDRTWAAVVAHAGTEGDEKCLLQLLNAKTVNQKRADALALIAAMINFKPQTPAKPPNWAFHETSLWRMAADQPTARQKA